MLEEDRSIQRFTGVIKKMNSATFSNWSRYLRVLSTVALMAAFTMPAYAATPPAPTAKRLVIEGKDIKLRKGGPAIWLKGATVREVSDAQADEIKRDLRFNLVRLLIEYEDERVNRVLSFVA